MVAILILAVLLFLPVPSLSQGVKVSTMLEVREALTPDVYVLPLTVSSTGDTEREVLGALGAVDEAVRDLGLPYRGGHYSVGPRCWWDEEAKKRVCKGYQGSVNYSFRLTEAHHQNRVLEAILGIKARAKVGLTVGTPRWEVSQERVRQKREELQLRLLREAREFAAKLSGSVGHKCRLSEADFETKPVPPFPPRTKALHAPEPTRTPQEISVRATVKYICVP